MPRAPKTCATPGCYSTTPCPDHAPPAWQGTTRRQRLPHDWQRTRRRILRRDTVCYLCGTNPATEVDHITAGDNHDPTNLAGICRTCHRWKSAHEGAAARHKQTPPHP